jgi:hypothetical protein
MQKVGSCIKRGVIGTAVVLLALVCFGMFGCSLFKTSVDNPKTDRTIWHSREQNVRIVKQDVIKGGTYIPNDQPVMLEPSQIRRALASLEVRLDRGGKMIPVFTEPELETLSGKLSEALAQAGPDQDVTFAVVGLRKALYGLAKQRKVTTGRVFYREGKLNIIFGKMIEDIKDERVHDYRADNDFRLNPLAPGSRTTPVSHVWELEEEPEMQFYVESGMYRGDWVVLDLASVAAHEALGIKPTSAASVGRQESVTPRRETLPQEGTQVQAPASPGPVTSVPQAGKSNKTIEERLTILNDLKNKKLITDEEYKAKRADILKDL